MAHEGAEDSEDAGKVGVLVEVGDGERAREAQQRARGEELREVVELSQRVVGRHARPQWRLQEWRDHAGRKERWRKERTQFGDEGIVGGLQVGRKKEMCEKHKQT